MKLTSALNKTKELLSSCKLCARACGVNRLKGELGYCKVGLKLKVFGAFPHFGEEAELVPSATLFLSGCTIHCVYCQNAPESVKPELGEEWSEEKAVEWIKAMEAYGCKNINFVGGEPTPYLYNILKIVSMAKPKVAIVWNSNGYYSEETAQILKEFVNIYLLDFRYYNERCALKYSNAPRYLEVIKRNLKLAERNGELIIRVLVIPEHLECCTKPILRWIKRELSHEVKVNILGQYWPAYRAFFYPEINRRLTKVEYNTAVSYGKKLGLNLIN